MNEHVVTVFVGIGLVIVIGFLIFAIRMSYEKMCIRTGRKFKSWLP